MPRSGERVRGLLQAAALDLFQEHGYDATTTAHIAARAGVNHRTFFRHFADKREVLFDGEAALVERLVDAARNAPAESAPLDVLRYSFRTVFPQFETNRAFAESRATLIRDNATLRERAAAKRATLATALAVALADRGAPPYSAAIAAEVGTTAFVIATEAWLRDPSAPLDDHLTAAYAELTRLAAEAGEHRAETEPSLTRATPFKDA